MIHDEHTSTSSDCSDGSDDCSENSDATEVQPILMMTSQPEPENTRQSPSEIKVEDSELPIKLESPEPMVGDSEACDVPRAYNSTPTVSNIPHSSFSSDSDTSDQDFTSAPCATELDKSQYGHPSHFQDSLSFFTSFLTTAKTSQAERSSIAETASSPTTPQPFLSSSPQTSLDSTSGLIPTMSVTDSPHIWTAERPQLHSDDRPPQRPPLLRRPPFEPVERPLYTHASTGRVRSPRYGKIHERRLRAMPYGGFHNPYYENRHNDLDGAGQPVQIPEQRMREELLGPLNNRFNPAMFESHSWNGSDSLPWVHALPRVNAVPQADPFFPLFRHRSLTARRTDDISVSANPPSFENDYLTYSHLDPRPLETLPNSDPSRNWIYNLGASSAVTRAGTYPYEPGRLVPVLIDEATGDIFSYE